MCFGPLHLRVLWEVLADVSDKSSALATFADDGVEKLLKFFSRLQSGNHHFGKKQWLQLETWINMRWTYGKRTWLKLSYDSFLKNVLCVYILYSWWSYVSSSYQNYTCLQGLGLTTLATLLAGFSSQPFLHTIQPVEGARSQGWLLRCLPGDLDDMKDWCSNRVHIVYMVEIPEYLHMAFMTRGKSHEHLSRPVTPTASSCSVDFLTSSCDSSSFLWPFSRTSTWYSSTWSYWFFLQIGLVYRSAWEWMWLVRKMMRKWL